MEKLIQEKQWAELKAYCLEKLLAGIENAEKIVDTLIEELAKKDFLTFPTFSNSTPRDSDEMFKQQYLGSFEPDRSSTTWRFLEGGEKGDIVGVSGGYDPSEFDVKFDRVSINAPDEELKIIHSGVVSMPRYDYISAIENGVQFKSVEKQDDGTFLCVFGLPEYPSNLPVSRDGVKSSTDRYSEEQFERRYKAANSRYLNPDSSFGVPVYQDGCFAMTKEQIEEAEKSGARLNYKEHEDGNYLATVLRPTFEEQHSKRLDKEVEEISPVPTCSLEYIMQRIMELETVLSVGFEENIGERSVKYTVQALDSTEDDNVRHITDTLKPAGARIAYDLIVVNSA